MTDPTGGAGPYSDGVTFTYQHHFALGGDHEFYFEFSDGTRSVRLPTSGTLWGPMNGYYHWAFEDTSHFTCVGEWEWGHPTYGPLWTHSGQRCWAVYLNSGYGFYSAGRLMTPPLDLTTGGSSRLELKFWHWYDTEYDPDLGGIDGGNVKVITPGDTVVIHPDTSQCPEYPEQAMSPYNSFIPGEPGYSGHPRRWEEAIFDLSPWAGQSGVIIAWDFGADLWNSYAGWYIDDVVIWGDPPLPVELSAFTAAGGDGRVTLSWTTESEHDNRGFHIWRREETESEFRRLTTEMIPGAGNSAGARAYTWEDRQVSCGRTYWYRLESVDYAGNGEFCGTVSATPEKILPATYTLEQNYPNPFNPDTWICYQLPEAGPVLLEVYNVRGQRVRNLYDADQDAGYYRIRWDGLDEGGERSASGIYFCQLRTPSCVRTIKMVLLR